MSFQQNTHVLKRLVLFFSTSAPLAAHPSVQSAMKSTYISGRFCGDDDNDHVFTYLRFVLRADDNDDSYDNNDDDNDYGDVLHLFEVRSQGGSLRLGKRRDCKALVRIGGSGQLEDDDD